MVVTGDRILPRITNIRPDSSKELAKHIDRILVNDLRDLQVNTIKPVKLTVVFWDISDFSSLCEDFAVFPGEIIYFLTQYFAKAIEIIKKHGGVLDKFMGDGILAYFGYNRTEDGDGDPCNAISAALEFRKQFSTLKADFAQICKKYIQKK